MRNENDQCEKGWLVRNIVVNEIQDDADDDCENLEGDVFLPWEISYHSGATRAK